jgi:hypothetical protein
MRSVNGRPNVGLAASHSENSGQPEPLFILSPPRSYSTVITAMLAGHPDIYSLPEMLLFTAPTVGELLTVPQQGPTIPKRWLEARQSGPKRAVAELHEGCQSRDALLRAEDWLNHHSGWTTARLMDHLRSLIRERLVVEKSPDTTSADERLRRCLETYPDAYYLHLTRHPAHCQRSMHKLWAHIYQDHDVALVARAAAAWYRAHLRIMRALDELPSGQSMRVRAEDILLAPDVWLPKILGWLDLPAPAESIDRMLNPQNWCFANTGPDGTLYGGDISFMRSPSLRQIVNPGPTVFDPSWRLPDEMADRMITLAGILGY